MFDYRTWCRLCGELEGTVEPDFDILALIQQTFEISTLDQTRICTNCDTALKKIIALTRKAKDLERLYEGLLQENECDLTVKRLNAYRAHFKLETMLPDVFVVEETDDLIEEEQDDDEHVEYIEFDVNGEEVDSSEVTVAQSERMINTEKLGGQDEELICIEADGQNDTLIVQDEDFEIEEETYDEGQFNEEVESSSEQSAFIVNSIYSRAGKNDVERLFTFQCHLCAHEEFLNMNQLTKHCKELHNALPIVKCCSDDYEAVLSTWRRLIIHKEKHFPHDNQIKCTECQKVYLTRAGLERHMLSHKIRFTCNQCGREFKEAKVLRSHESIHAVPLEDRRNHHCTHDECDKKFSSKQALQNHIAMRHEQHVTNKCKVSGCDRSFFTRKAYNSHLRGVHGERKFSCNQCSFKATTKSALNNHNVTHKIGEKRFSCDICNASFLVLQRLRSHMIVHLDVAPFQCQECPASFKRSRDLRSHSTTHTKLRPHSCQFCFKDFASQPNCRKHKLKEHPDELKAWEKENGAGGRKNLECYR